MFVVYVCENPYLFDDNEEAYDLNLIWSEVDGGFYDIGDHLAGYKLAYDGPG